MVEKKDPARAAEFDRLAQAAVQQRVAFYQKMAAAPAAGTPAPAAAAPAIPTPKPPPKNGDGGPTIKSVTSG
jgi:hypothetical protein